MFRPTKRHGVVAIVIVVVAAGVLNIGAVSTLAQQDVQQESEPNNVHSEADSITPGVPVEGVTEEDQTDEFVFEAEAGQTMTLEVSADRSVQVEVVTGSPDYTIIDQFYSDETQSIQFQIPESGTYYISVFPENLAEGDQSIPYTFTLSGGGEESTATATPTETATATPTETATATPTEKANTSDGVNDNGGTGSSGAFGPGFGIVGVLIALLASAFLAVRRR